MLNLSLPSYIFALNAQTQGTIWHVKPYSGKDSRDGKSPANAFKTLVQAQSKAVANRNDIVLLYAESNTAGNTTDYQSATLDWAKDMVHLIGVNAGQRFSQRSRIGFISTYDTASNLMTVSADACLISGLEIFAGVAGTLPTGCLKVTGTRNHFLNCQIAGIGHDNNDITGAFSLQLYGNASENYFENCVIGCDTISRGTAVNSEILVTYATYRAARNVFKGCYIVGWCASAGNYTFLTADSGSIDRFMLFDDCVFTNPGASVSGGAAMTYAFIVTSANGKVILHNSTIVGAADVANDPGTIVSNAPPVNGGDFKDLSIAQVVIKT